MCGCTCCEVNRQLEQLKKQLQDLQIQSIKDREVVYSAGCSWADKYHQKVHENEKLQEELNQRATTISRLMHLKNKYLTELLAEKRRNHGFFSNPF